MTTRRVCALVLLLAGAAVRAQGIESNFKPYVVGGRAAGMGGAFTALADDGSGGYYNPGGLAFARSSSVSFSLNVYGFAGGTVKDALGDGQDFVYRDLQDLPGGHRRHQEVRRGGARDRCSAAHCVLLGLRS